MRTKARSFGIRPELITQERTKEKEERVVE